MSVFERMPAEFSAPPMDQVLDLHGDPAHADLVLFMHGNQWMVIPDLLHGFQETWPEIENVYYETLPPGILVQQLRRGALRLGELLIRVAPDVLTSDIDTLSQLAGEGWLREYHEYARNTLAILVATGNPHRISSWQDLLRPEVRVALPDPETEGIGHLVRAAVTDSLGAEAWQLLAERKRQSGSTIVTKIHHRQAPLYIERGAVDAAPVWLTEGLYQTKIKAPTDTVRLPTEQTRQGHYGVAILERTSTHQEAARAFADWILGPGQKVYASYGFEVPQPATGP